MSELWQDHLRAVNRSLPPSEMDRRQPFRDFSFPGLLPARSRFASRLVCGLLLVSLVMVQALPAAFWLPGTRGIAATNGLSLAAPDGIEWGAEANPPATERRCESEDCAKRTKATDLAVDELARSGRITPAYGGKESDLAAQLRRGATLVDLQVRLQI